ncbi:MAG: ESPR domain-containing protein, partial [Paraburkholderia sp.]|nr:ESPR domain-containing protein [Paraburkholderia sp.]
MLCSFAFRMKNRKRLAGEKSEIKEPDKAHESDPEGGMNKAYRCVWNEALGAWVAVSELDKARGKRSKSKLVLAAAAAGASLAAVLAPAPAFASFAITDTGMTNTASGPSERTASSGGKGASASANSIAMVGDGDCNRLTNISYGGIYGNGDSKFTGGLYGFSVQTRVLNYDDAYNVGPGQTAGMPGFSSVTRGNVTETGNGIAQTQSWGLNTIALGCDTKANGYGAFASG